jgi:hypothetical protein
MHTPLHQTPDTHSHTRFSSQHSILSPGKQSPLDTHPSPFHTLPVPHDDTHPDPPSPNTLPVITNHSMMASTQSHAFLQTITYLADTSVTRIDYQSTPRTHDTTAYTFHHSMALNRTDTLGEHNHHHSTSSLAHTLSHTCSRVSTSQIQEGTREMSRSHKCDHQMRSHSHTQHWATHIHQEKMMTCLHNHHYRTQFQQCQSKHQQTHT